MPDTGHSDSEVFATKTELAEQEARMTRETHQLVREMTRELRDRIDSWMTEMRELHADMQDKMDSSFAELREALHDLKCEMARRDRWNITTVLAIAAAVIALMRFEII